jgi:predicted alpha/beta superfamily hydrolase
VNDDVSPLAGAEVHYRTATESGHEYKIHVGHCGDGTGEPTGVLYVPDGNGYFGGAVDMVRNMQFHGHVPPLLVVGIGYRARSLFDTIPDRSRDLTPTYHRGYAQIYTGEKELGGAPGFFEFLRDDLMPWVGAHYPVDPADGTYFGHSLGGLFGVYTLLREPETFRRYAIGSPSLWWHRAIAFLGEAEYAAAHDDLRADVYFAIGADETQDGRMRESARRPPEELAVLAQYPIDMVDDLERFVAALRSRNYPNLRVRCDVFPDEFHSTVAFLILSRALRWFFDPNRAAAR